jgi:rhodanese-related sulfurtransferase
MPKILNLSVCTLALLINSSLPHAQEEAPGLDAMLEAFEFAPYQGGNIRPEQLSAGDLNKFYLIDTRRPQDYALSHIPGAVNIEWRQVLARRDELPDDASLLLYCNTGSLSAQAAFALKASGREAVFILTGGYDAWSKAGNDGITLNSKKPVRQDAE